MSKDDFTRAEMKELFGDKPIRRRPRLPKAKRLPNDSPYLPDPGDPAYIKRRPKIIKGIREKSTKVLTIKNRGRIIKPTIKRKDGKVATKSKTQTNYTQRIAVCLLAGGAVLGFADQLGGGLKACAVAALLVGCLFVLAIDFDK